MVLNILEAFFRRPFLHLLPLVLMLGLGVASVVNLNDEYTSVGTLSVTNESLLADLTNASSVVRVHVREPGDVSGPPINELPAHDEFLDKRHQPRPGSRPLVQSGPPHAAADPLVGRRLSRRRQHRPRRRHL